MLTDMVKAIACDCVAAALAEMIEVLSDTLDSRLEPCTEEDLRNLGNPLPCRSKRRRTDEDYKEFVIVKAVRLGRCNAGSQYRRVIGHGAESSTRGWEKAAIGSHIMVVKDIPFAGVTSLCEDGSTNGLPAEDTTNYFVYDCRDYKSGMLPNKVT